MPGRSSRNALPDKAMRGTIVRITGLGLAALCALVQPAVAQPRKAEQVIEKLEHGQINWSDKNVLATGSGAPDATLPNVAAIRLNAERAAKVSAFRNVLETLKGLRISAKVTGKQVLAEGPVRTQVEGIVRGCKVVDTRYYSDGGVDVVLQCPLDGGLATSLAPVRDSAVKKTMGRSSFTGLIVDASGLAIKPALHPRLLDNGGTEVYSAKMVAPNALRQHGAAAYVKSVANAKASARSGKNPLVVKAARLGPTPTDLVLASGDLQKLKAESQAFLTDAKVVIVTGAP